MHASVSSVHVVCGSTCLIAKFFNTIFKLHSILISIVKSFEVSTQYRFWVKNLPHFGVRVRLIEVSAEYRFILQ